MTKEQDKEMRRQTRVLLYIQRRIHPLDFQCFIGALLANVVGAIPDDYWARMMVTKPCSTPDCDCHVISASVMASLNLLRNDHIKTLGGRASRN
jgi:hypothetical protein